MYLPAYQKAPAAKSDEQAARVEPAPKPSNQEARERIAQVRHKLLTSGLEEDVAQLPAGTRPSTLRLGQV